MADPRGRTGRRTLTRPGLVDAGVAVQAGNPEVDADQVEHEAGESDELDVGRLAAPPAGRGPGVQVPGVHHPGDERPRLLGVPAPVPAPGLVRPDRPGDDRER